MNKTQQIDHTIHKTRRRSKPRFIVTHKYNGSQSGVVEIPNAIINVP